MEYRKIEIGSYNLRLIKTDKFKTIFFKFIFRDEIKKDEITIRNLLLNVMFSSCKNYPTERLMNIRKEELYGLNFYASNRRIGYHIASDMNFSILNPKYTNDIMLEESMDFIRNIIFNPNINNNKFNDETVEIEKNLIKSNIISMKDYASSYSWMKAKELLDDTNPFSYNMEGYLEDLEKIDSNSLAEYYQKFINNSLLDIFVVGDIDFYEMEKLIRKNIDLKTRKKDKVAIVKEYQSKTKKEMKIMEQGPFKQTSLIIAMSLKKLTEVEKKYTMFLYNTILGNYPDSKLFRTVREKKSLTYNINSYYQKNDNVMFIKTGLMASTVNDAIEAIKIEMNNMIKGDFEEEILNNAKELIISSLNEFEEYQNSIAEYYFSMDYLKIDTVDNAIKTIKKITKEDIMKVAKKVKIDLIYLLKEKDNGED